MHAYIKGPDRPPPKPPKKPRKIAGIASGAFLILGVFLILQATWPVVSWYFFTMPSVSIKILSPLVRPVEALSYDPSSWFAQGFNNGVTTMTPLKTYTISIPKLKIDKANVEVGGNLKKTLVAWPNSSLPGVYGNNIIFGHSELPQFASPKDYSGMFTFIMDLVDGDDIFIEYDGIKYHYKVHEKRVVEVNDISVLEQRFDTAYVTLITCVPPGTLWKRGIIKAKLVKI